MLASNLFNVPITDFTPLTDYTAICYMCYYLRYLLGPERPRTLPGEVGPVPSRPGPVQPRGALLRGLLWFGWGHFGGSLTGWFLALAGLLRRHS